MSIPMKNIFLGTAGMSPQVITESLYAIAKDEQYQDRWPQEIYVITTLQGKNKVYGGLVEQGHLARLCRELGRPIPTFDHEHLLVIHNQEGELLDDARSVGEHNAVANFITTCVRNYTKDANTSVTASLAGGRKTMTFYMGYAMSLFGRPQDKLTHVLVGEGYESHPDFWFPTEAEAWRSIKTREGKVLDASEAEVTLAGIPFVRHRPTLPHQQLDDLRSPIDFERLVHWINLGDEPEYLTLTLNVPARTVTVGDTRSPVTECVTLGIQEFAYYRMMVRATLEGDGELTRPKNATLDKGLRRTYLEELLRVCDPKSAAQAANFSVPELIQALRNWDSAQLSSQLSEKSLESWEGDRGFNASWFDVRKSNLQKAFGERLPSNLVEKINVSIIYSEEGQRLATNASRSNKGGYGINIPPVQLHVCETEP